MAQQNLKVDPAYLRERAGYQDEAAAKSADSTQKTKDVYWDAWWTHGVASSSSNLALTSTQTARAEAAAAIAKASSDLSVALRTAADAYEAVDADLSANFKSQMLDK